MGIIDKLFFWRKKDIDFEKGLDLKGADLGIGKDNLGLAGERDLGIGIESPESTPLFTRERNVRAAQAFETQGMQQPSNQFFPQQQSQLAQPYSQLYNKEVELISAKLDVLKASLDNINQRLANIEKIAKESQQNNY